MGSVMQRWFEWRMRRVKCDAEVVQMEDAEGLGRFRKVEERLGRSREV